MRLNPSEDRPRGFSALAGLFLLAACTLPGPAFAAGGHFAVDDASILDAGQCQVEVWHEHEEARRLVHEGPACRFGDLEWGLNLDQQRWAPTGTSGGAGFQVKGVRTLSDTWAMGLVVAVYRTPSTPLSGRATTPSLLATSTWQVAPEFAVHANLGRDWPGGQPALTRRGLAAEWTSSSEWTWVAEWAAAGPERLRRLGARYTLSEAWSFDLSRADTNGRRWWAAGATWTFDR